jgi:hypothetical protein
LLANFVRIKSVSKKRKSRVGGHSALLGGEATVFWGKRLCGRFYLYITAMAKPNLSTRFATISK